MSEEIQELQRQIVDAVQQELARFSGEVALNLKSLSDEVAAGAAARSELELQVQSLTDARSELELQVDSLSEALEASQAANTRYQTELPQALEARLDAFSDSSKSHFDEMSKRLGRVVDEANVGIAAAVKSAAHPILKKLEDRQDGIESEVRELDGSLREFDAQAGRMVEHINQVTVVIESRLERVQADVLGKFDDRMSEMVTRIDEVSAMAARQKSEVSNLIGDRVDSSESRINERMLGLENRIHEDIGQRVADIDAHVGRIGVGLDEAVITLNDRIASADSKFTDVESTIADLRTQMENVDEEAIDEMKDKISSALGQAELVRIEMERFQETIKGSLDKTAVRLTEIETTVQEQAMDVETAVQLERLEEVERAVLMLDPDIIRSRNDAHEPAGPAPFEQMADHFEAPPASAPLSPPTADPTRNSESGHMDPSMSFQPPAMR